MRRFLFVLTLLFCSCCQTIAGTAEQKGLAIMEEADRRTSGYKNYSADMVMILRNRKNEESSRTIRSRVLETAEDGDKSLNIFDTPKDVRGTALLTFTHKFSNDDQWLYLPALKRVKRINSSNKSGPFMGSEFAYEDLGSHEVEKYTYRYLTDTEFQGHQCFIVERKPKDTKNSGYLRILTWLDKSEYRVWQEEYYDKKNRLLKTLTLADYRQYLDYLWKPHRMEMINHQSGKETDFLISNYRFQTGLTDKDFSKSSLKRLR